MTPAGSVSEPTNVDPQRLCVPGETQAAGVAAKAQRRWVERCQRLLLMSPQVSVELLFGRRSLHVHQDAPGEAFPSAFVAFGLIL